MDYGTPLGSHLSCPGSCIPSSVRKEHRFFVDFRVIPIADIEIQALQLRATTRLHNVVAARLTALSRYPCDGQSKKKHCHHDGCALQSNHCGIPPSRSGFWKVYCAARENWPRAGRESLSGNDKRSAGPCHQKKK